MLTAAPGRGTTQTVFMCGVGVLEEKSLTALWMEKERGEVGGIPQAVSQGLVGWSQETRVKQDQSCQTSRGKV